MATELDPSAPVLVGAASVAQREDDPSRSREAAALMSDALRAAAADAGVPSLVDRVDEVLVPEGTWGYTDPGRLLGAPAGARTVRADIGVLQQSLLSRAACDVRDGRAAVVAVCGGEAKHRALRATITGVPAPETDQAGAEPDEVLRPAEEILPDVEITRGLAWPVRQYAVMESALRHADGVAPDAAQRHLDALWARFSAVAAANPEAWEREPISAEELASLPMLSSPYTKRHASQWNVDQAAAVLLTSVAVAEDLGIDRSRWVFPHIGVESNHMVPLSARAQLARCPAMAVAADVVRDRTRWDPSTVQHLDLYSCFPVAVRLQCREMGIDEARDLTVTGGMAFAGGPLNNYVLGALVTMVGVLRDEPSGAGLVSSVSGMLTKYGVGIWSCRPPSGSGFEAVDISDAVERSTPLVDVDPDYAGPAIVVGATVASERDAPDLALVLADAPSGVRAVAATDVADVVEAVRSGDPVGLEVTVRGGELVHVGGSVAGR